MARRVSAEEIQVGDDPLSMMLSGGGSDDDEAKSAAPQPGAAADDGGLFGDTGSSSTAAPATSSSSPPPSGGGLFGDDPAEAAKKKAAIKEDLYGKDDKPSLLGASDPKTGDRPGAGYAPSTTAAEDESLVVPDLSGLSFGKGGKKKKQGGGGGGDDDDGGGGVTGVRGRYSSKSKAGKKGGDGDDQPRNVSKFYHGRDKGLGLGGDALGDFDGGFRNQDANRLEPDVDDILGAATSKASQGGAASQPDAAVFGGLDDDEDAPVLGSGAGGSGGLGGRGLFDDDAPVDPADSEAGRKAAAAARKKKAAFKEGAGEDEEFDLEDHKVDDLFVSKILTKGDDDAGGLIKTNKADETVAKLRVLGKTDEGVLDTSSLDVLEQLEAATQTKAAKKKANGAAAGGGGGGILGSAAAAASGKSAGGAEMDDDLFNMLGDSAGDTDKDKVDDGFDFSSYISKNEGGGGGLFG